MEIQKFDRLGYSFRSDLSSDSEYVFERKIKIVIILIIIKDAKPSIFYLNNYFIFRSNTYSESEDKSDLNEYPSLSNF